MNCAFPSDIGAGKPFHCLATNSIFSLDFLEKTQGVPFYIYDDEGNKTENITNWALEQFKMNYQKDGEKSINKKAVFEYCYAVLHDPIYREKYTINLKRDFPNIPFYKGFQQWADWGKELMGHHIGFEKANPYPLKRTDTKTSKTSVPKTKLKADKDNGVIFIDEETSLTGIPAEAWQYKLGNRSALEWILDQYKESKPKDPTIRAKFDTYRFADYKEQVIELLMRTTTVSVETMKIIEKMNKTNR